MATTITIISGGQSGVDRAALDFAIQHRIQYRGWCPQGGWAEDYPRPPGLLARYPGLTETPLADLDQRTEWNVRDSDATAIIVNSTWTIDSKGTRLTESIAQRLNRLVIVIDVGADDAAQRLTNWLCPFDRTIALNVAGPRESECPGIYEQALALLQSLPNDLLNRRTDDGASGP